MCNLFINLFLDKKIISSDQRKLRGSYDITLLHSVSPFESIDEIDYFIGEYNFTQVH